jgi:hypothetical protein
MSNTKKRQNNRMWGRQVLFHNCSNVRIHMLALRAGNLLWGGFVNMHDLWGRNLLLGRGFVNMYRMLSRKVRALQCLLSLHWLHLHLYLR